MIQIIFKEKDRECFQTPEEKCRTLLKQLILHNLSAERFYDAESLAIRCGSSVEVLLKTCRKLGITVKE